jgi:DNA-binding transcriptional ArsR family regulator
MVAMTTIVLIGETNVNCDSGRRVMTPAEVLLHPVRLRIVQEFLGRGELTTAALRSALADIPVASLYRHITVLLEAGILSVADERKVRGALERTFVMRVAAANVTGEDAAAMSVEEHRQAFMTFVAGLLGTFDRYLDQGDIDLARDLVGYRQAAIHLTDAETNELLEDLRAVIEPRLRHAPAPDRTRRMLTTVLMPAAHNAGPEKRGAAQTWSRGAEYDAV